MSGDGNGWRTNDDLLRFASEQRLLVDRGHGRLRELPLGELVVGGAIGRSGPSAARRQVAELLREFAVQGLYEGGPFGVAERQRLLVVAVPVGRLRRRAGRLVGQVGLLLDDGVVFLQVGCALARGGWQCLLGVGHALSAVLLLLGDAGVELLDEIGTILRLVLLDDLTPRLVSAVRAGGVDRLDRCVPLRQEAVDAFCGLQAVLAQRSDRDGVRIGDG